MNTLFIYQYYLKDTPRYWHEDDLRFKFCFLHGNNNGGVLLIRKLNEE